MNKATNVIFLSLLGLSLSSCATLERMEKERIEKEKQELAQMRSYNAGLVSFYESEMKPLLKDQGQLKKENSFDPNDPKFDLEGRYMEVSWVNRVSLLLTGHVYRTNINKQKVNTAQSILISKYRNHIEKKGGVIKEGDKDKAKRLVEGISANDECLYHAPLFGYIKNNLDSAFLPFICIGDSGYGGKTRSGQKQSIKVTTVHFRVIDGVMIEQKLSGSSSSGSFFPEAKTRKSNQEIFSDLGESAVKVKNSFLKLLN